MIRLGVNDFFLKKDLNVDRLMEQMHHILEHELAAKNIQELSRKAYFDQKKKETIDELVVTVCHEFNNPLAAIKITTDILSRHEQIPAVKESLHQITKQILRIEKSISRFRDEREAHSQAVD